jgi:hypothetical protein
MRDVSLEIVSTLFTRSAADVFCTAARERSGLHSSVWVEIAAHDPGFECNARRAHGFPLFDSLHLPQPRPLSMWVTGTSIDR